MADLRAFSGFKADIMAHRSGWRTQLGFVRFKARRRGSPAASFRKKTNPPQPQTPRGSAGKAPVAFLTCRLHENAGLSRRFGRAGRRLAYWYRLVSSQRRLLRSDGGRCLKSLSAETHSLKTPKGTAAGYDAGTRRLRHIPEIFLNLVL